LGTACDPAIPHKAWFFRVVDAFRQGTALDQQATLSQVAAWEQENWLELERWARQFRLECQPESGAGLLAKSWCGNGTMTFEVE
jgi:hypothetical protein